MIYLMDVNKNDLDLEDQEYFGDLSINAARKFDAINKTAD